MKILFVVPALAGGGAERQLCLLALGLQRAGHDVTIAVFRPGGVYEHTLLAGSRVTVRSLDKRSTAETIRFLLRARRLARDVAPDVIHGYMDLGNVIATVMRRFVPDARLAWGVRVARLDRRQYDPLGRLVHELNRRLAHVPDVIICNSAAGAEECVNDGYPSARVHVVPNGIDTDAFMPDPAGGARVRQEWGIPPGSRVVGLVARLDPVKDHATFAAAAKRLSERDGRVYFVCVGDGEEPYRSRVESILRDSGLGERLIRSGFRNDMPAVYSAFDVSTSCSLSEGFSNTLAEAMACGVPCVATDAGDARLILGDTGIVVESRNPVALADAWQRLLDCDRMDIRDACRRRIVDSFSAEALTSRTAELLERRN